MRAELLSRAALERFMQARIDGDETAVLNLLTDRLHTEVMRGEPNDVPFTQASNPCWYRYAILRLDQVTPTRAQARVRVYEHQWPGDNAGGLPKSWEQELTLVETPASWRVDQMGKAENERQEPDEPHGPTLSACNAWKQTPANAESARTPTPTPVAHSGISFPLALGNTWIYSSTRYDALPITEFITATSTITETVIDIKNSPTYLAAHIQREVGAETLVFVATSRQGEPLRPAETSTYWLVVQDNRIYRQEGNLDLKFGDRDGLEFVFPLDSGAKWVWLPASLPSNPATEGVFRKVLMVGAVLVPAGHFDNCFLIKDDWVTDTAENWFCPGVGWVDMKDDHNGTPFGSHQVLLKYQLK